MVVVIEIEMTNEERNRLFLAIKSRIGYDASLEHFATNAGLSRGIVYTWLKGKADPRWDSLKMLARALNISMSQLVGEIEGGPVRRRP